MPTEKIISKPCYSSVLLKISLALFLFSALSAPAQNQNKPDSTSNGLYAEVEKLFAQQVQINEQNSLKKVELQGRLQLSDGEEAIRLLGELDTLAMNDSSAKAQLVEKLQLIKITAAALPVAPFKDTLFFINANLHLIPAKERVATLNKWMKKMYRDPRFTAESLSILDRGTLFHILYNSRETVLTVSEVDALWFSKKGEDLAKDLVAKIIAGVEAEKQINLTKDRIEKSVWVLLIVLCLCIVVFLINKVFKYIKNFLSKQKLHVLNGITIGKFVLFTPAEHEMVAHKLVNFTRLITILVAVYFSLPLLFSIFPITEKWATTLFGLVFTPAKSAFTGVINFIPDFFTILVIYYIFKYCLQVARFFAQQVEEGDVEIDGFHRDWAQPTFDIFRVLMYAFMLILIFPYLPGSSSAAFQGVSVFLGVLLSLGSSNAIANVIAGLVITYMRPFKVGDRVNIGIITGDVIEKTLLVTRIRTIKNEEVTVPNATVLSSNTTNYTAHTKPQDTGLILHTKVTMGYDMPWQQVHEILIKAALKTPHVLQEPKPFVLNLSLDDFYVSYQINVYTKEPSLQNTIYSDLHQNIQDA
ncbi:MAG: mechanosensitive ion channel family protein [Bacteroidetes bacterium]|nr:mechanosensitive ion channel family protein [Bacteroidota bacterium]